MLDDSNGFDYEWMYPDDIKLFKETIHLTFDGKSAQCDIRVKRDEEYCWHSCRFEPYYDVEKDGNIVIMMITDVSLLKKSIHGFE